jgi:transposase InsO family protein
MAKIFNPEEIEFLSKNENVTSVNEKFIIYSNEFKKFFVEQYLEGKGPTLIFESAGLPKRILGSKRIEKCTKRWMTAYQNGTLNVSASLLKPKKEKLKKTASKDSIIKYQEAKIKLLEAEVELLKKLELNERRPISDRNLSSSYIFELISMIIKENNLKNVVSYLCKSAGVSRSGYYNYINNADKRAEREKQDLEDKELIMWAVKYKKFKKGSRTIKTLLQDNKGVNFNRKKILRLMRKYNIVCTIRKAKNPYKITKEHKSVPNYVQRKFKTGIPGKVLLTDISYLKYGTNSTAYLSTVLDAETKEIVSYNVSNSLKLDIVMETLDKLKENKFINFEKAILHSDQGWHYTNPQFRVRVSRLGITQSMSRKGNCWDNAPQESFFGHLKDEATIKDCVNYEDVVQLIDEYMYYYNNERHQANIKNMTPVQYRKSLLVA